jgi:hypothetical protein
MRALSLLIATMATIAGCLMSSEEELLIDSSDAAVDDVQGQFCSQTCDQSDSGSYVWVDDPLNSCPSGQSCDISGCLRTCRNPNDVGNRCNGRCN